VTGSEVLEAAVVTRVGCLVQDRRQELVAEALRCAAEGSCSAALAWEVRAAGLASLEAGRLEA